MSCGKIGVGDRGQRFEIRYIDAVTGAEKVMGWAPTRDGADGMANAMKSAPYVRETRVIDRLAEGYTGI